MKLRKFFFESQVNLEPEVRNVFWCSGKRQKLVPGTNGLHLAWTFSGPATKLWKSKEFNPSSKNKEKCILGNCSRTTFYWKSLRFFSTAGSLFHAANIGHPPSSQQGHSKNHRDAFSWPYMLLFSTYRTYQKYLKTNIITMIAFPCFMLNWEASHCNTIHVQRETNFSRLQVSSWEGLFSGNMLVSGWYEYSTS